MKVSVAERIRRRIHRAGPGAIFLVRDFLDLGSRHAVDETLRRLTQQGMLRRLQQGVYDYPRVSSLLGILVPPDPAQVAAALARRTGNRIFPTEAQVASALGLTTQVQARNVFLTNGGKKRQFKVGEQTIELRPTAARYFPLNQSEAVIQGLRFVGEGNITEQSIQRLKAQLNNRQKAALRRKLPDAPGWMQPALLQIVEKTPENL